MFEYNLYKINECLNITFRLTAYYRFAEETCLIKIVTVSYLYKLFILLVEMSLINTIVLELIKARMNLIPLIPPRDTP